MITFVATMFHEMDSAKMFIGALQSQTNKNWECIIYHNGPNPRKQEILDLIDNRFMYIESPTNTENWGTLNRQDAIENLVKTSHVIQTSIHDYWIPLAVEEISKYLGNDFIYFNSINHLFGYHTTLNCEPVPGMIDWGNFCIKNDIARQIGIKYPKEFRADGLFVSDCFNSRLVKSSVKISKILTIHN